MDTIVYRLHNLKNYTPVVSCVQMLEDGKGKMQVPEEYTSEEMRFKKFSNLWFNLKHDFYHILTYNTKVHLPSSESNVSIFYDRGQDNIRFEFSIPKFYFGNNVLELIPPLHSKYYTPNPGMKSLANYWLRIIKKTFLKIIIELTNGIQSKVDFSDVEVSRFDICFNQMFDSRRDALLYLDAQKQIKAKRVQDKKHVNYETSLSIQTNDYYFKIYHKGTEFAAVGRKDLHRNFDTLNRQKRIVEGSNFYKSYTNLEKIQDHADNILRYELEARKPLMSYLFAYHVNKQFLPKYRSVMKLVYFITDRDGHYELLTGAKRMWRDQLTGKEYKTKTKAPGLSICEPVYYLFDTKSDKVQRLEDFTQVQKLNKMYRVLEILKDRYSIEGLNQIKKLHQFFKKEQGKEFRFFLDRKPEWSDFQNTKNHLHTYMETPSEQVFNIEMIYLIIHKFETLFKSYQLKEMPSVQYVQELAEKYNQTLKLSGSKKKKLNINHVKLLFSHINNGYSLDQLRQTGNYSRQTIYNYRKKIDLLLGLGKNYNFSPDINAKNIPQDPKTLYSKHYSQLLHNNYVLQLFLTTLPTHVNN